MSAMTPLLPLDPSPSSASPSSPMTPLSPSARRYRPTRLWRWRMLALVVVLVIGLVALRVTVGSSGGPRGGTWGTGGAGAGGAGAGAGLGAGFGGLGLGDPRGWGMGLLGGMPGLSLGVGRAVRGLRVAVVEPTEYHSEVLSSILSVLDELQINATVYSWSQAVTDATNVFRPKHAALPGLQLASAVERGEFDVVILNTCDAKFWEHRVEQSETLHKIIAWASTPTEDSNKDKARSKYLPRVVCLPHELERYGSREEHDDIGLLSRIAEVGHLDHIALAAHSEMRLRMTLAAWSEVTRQGYWERASMGVESFVPVFPFPSGAAVPPKVPRERIHRAGIVGRISNENRDYNGTFRALETAILHNPALWGYSVINVPQPNSTRTRLRLIPMGLPDAENPNPQRVPDYTETSEAFTLHLIGYATEELRIPSLLNDEQWPVVRIETHDNAVDYYAAIREMDIIIPVFSDDSYYHSRASASIPAAIMAHTPILVTSQHLESYTYLSLFPSSHVLSPMALEPINALATLRRRADPWEEEFSDTLPRPTGPLAANAPGTWEAYLDILAAENRRVWGRVLARAVRG